MQKAHMSGQIQTDAVQSKERSKASDQLQETNNVSMLSDNSQLNMFIPICKFSGGEGR